MRFKTKISAILIIALVLLSGCGKDISSETTNGSLDSSQSQTIDKAVAKAIIDFGKDKYLKGETAAEGHKILELEQSNSKVKVYTISSFGYFGFENGIFTKISGSGAIPTVMTFTKKGSDWILADYQEPMDGSGNIASIKRMFPQMLWNKVLSQDNAVYANLAAQQEAQASDYLKKIGRSAKVASNYGERKLASINVSASNKLFSEFTKNDQFLNSCPYWIGSKEYVENGVRYIYETSQSKTNDGYDLITFKKKKADGTLIVQRIYKIIGTEPVLQKQGL